MIPLIIGGIAIVAVSIAVVKSSDSFGNAFKNLTTTEKQKDLNTSRESYEFNKQKRGWSDNLYAFVFGESALKQVNSDSAKPQAPITDTPRTLADARNRNG